MANEYDIQQAQLVRRRGLLNALTQQAFQQPQGQMVSGHYVAPGLLSTLAGPLTALAAGYGQEKLDQQEKDVATARAQALAQSLSSLRQGQVGGASNADVTNQLLSSQFPELQKVGQAAALEGLKPETFSTPISIQGPTGQPMVAQFGNRGTARPITGAAPYEKPSYGDVQTVTNPDGSLGYVAIDKSTGLPKPIEGYNAYVKPPAQTNINNNIPSQEKARDVALGTSEGKMMDSARQGIISSQRTFNLATKLEDLNNQGVFSGPTSRPAVLFNQLAGGLGFTPPPELAKKIANTENYNLDIGKEITNMILNSSAGRGFTDTDREFTEKSFPGLLLTPEGRVQAIGKLKEFSVNGADENQKIIDSIQSGNFNKIDLTGGKMAKYRQGQQAQPTKQGVPQTGAVVQGYKFLGGDPSNPTSWSKQ